MQNKVAELLEKKTDDVEAYLRKILPDAEPDEIKSLLGDVYMASHHYDDLDGNGNPLAWTGVTAKHKHIDAIRKEVNPKHGSGRVEPLNEGTAFLDSTLIPGSDEHLDFLETGQSIRNLHPDFRNAL